VGNDGEVADVISNAFHLLTILYSNIGRLKKGG